MSAPFAAIETALASGVVAALANVTATIGVASVEGLFDNEYVEFRDVAGTRPVLRAVSTEVSSVIEGTAVTVNAVSYTVAGIQPDGTGMTLLVLERT